MDNAARTDFYTLFHKGLRKRLFDVVVATGCTDFADRAAATAIAARLEALWSLLASHAEVEERFVHPFLKAKGSGAELVARLESEHRRHETEAHVLREQGRRLGAGGCDPGAALELYRGLARFVGTYLGHLDEEEAALPLLWALVDEPTLARTFADFQRSRSGEELAVSCELMLPGMNPPEREAMGRAIKVGAPAAAFALFCASARAALDEPAFATLTARLET